MPAEPVETSELSDTKGWAAPAHNELLVCGPVWCRGYLLCLQAQVETAAMLKCQGDRADGL